MHVTVDLYLTPLLSSRLSHLQVDGATETEEQKEEERQKEVARDCACAVPVLRKLALLLLLLSHPLVKALFFTTFWN